MEQRRNRKTRVGVVVSNKMAKTVVVKVERRVADPKYGKIVTKAEKYKAHDEQQSCQIGDKVRIVETRPLSKDKRWRVVEILEKMRVPLTGLEVEVEGERAQNPPRRYTAIRLRFRAAGVPPDAEDRLRRAVALSAEKYCSVLHSLRPDVVVESDVALQ